jgi:hypothetical protein
MKHFGDFFPPPYIGSSWIFFGERERSRIARETRERWPLPTVATAVNGDSKSTNDRGPSLFGSFGLT